MKKTIFGVMAALLGAILGVGGAFYYGLTKPAANAQTAGQTPAPAASKSVEGKVDASKGDAAKSGAPVGTPAAPKSAGSPAPAGGAGGNATPVEIAKVETRALPKSVTAVGTLRSDESTMVRSEVAGRIVNLNFKDGQRVTRGQVLLKLDDSLARAELEQARANQRLAKAKFDRARELKERGFVSGQAQDEAENALKVADAAVTLVDARLARLTIVAPYSGTIGLRSVSLGDYIKDGQDIVNLEKIDPIKVDFKVPELFASSVRPGQQLQIDLDAVSGSSYTGVVIAVNPQLDTAGRAIVLRAQLPNRDGTLKPGMFARVRLLLNENADALVIPEQALMPQGEEQFVFKVVEGRVARTKVTIGTRRDGIVEIENGLTADDTVVTAGWQRVRDGAAVRAAPAANASAAKGDPAKRASGNSEKNSKQ